MKTLIGLFIGLLTVQSAFAEQTQFEKVMLDDVHFKISARQWVKTNTAKLTVNVNAILSNTNLQKARNEILINLKSIAQGEWHITTFNRSQDRSGLEKLYVLAEARVPQSTLTNVNVNANRVGKAGVRYRVQNIDFSPSLEDVSKVRHSVRLDLYQQVKKEIASLNKLFPSQKYSLHELNVGANNFNQAANYRANEMLMRKSGRGASAIAVSNEVKINAVVTLSSNRGDIQ